MQTSGASCSSPIEPIMVPVESEYGPRSEIPLGKGAYGTVTKHVSAKHGTVAIKHIPCPDNELPANAIREIATLISLFPHKDIITILGFELPQFNVANEGSKDVNIVMEHGIMSLSKAIKEKIVGGDNDETCSIMHQLLRGTNYMHQKDIWHRDIKPGNVIVTQLQPTIKVKLADFGLSRSGPYCGISQTQVMYTIWYRPPEILINQLLPKKGFSYDEMAETWALGIVFWDILAAKSSIAAKDLLRTKYDTNDPTNQLLLIFKSFGFGPDQISLRQKLIKRYWAFSETAIIDPTIQSPITKLKAFVKMRDVTSELLEKMLTLNPSKRISVTEAMSSKYFDSVSDIARVAPETIKTLLALETKNISRESINSKLPGENYQKQLHNYTVTAQRMLRFAHETGMIKDLGTFSLSITLFHCIISLEKTKFESLKNLYAAGLVCCTLAGKYYARNHPQIESVATSLGDGTNSKIVADFETYAFKQLHGKLHQPSAYRFLVEMLSCQRNTSSQKLLFAWSFGILCSIECSKAVFVGKPSDLARLSIQIAAHYLKYDLSEHPLAAMETRELKQGAKIVYGTFSTLNPKIRQTFVADISKTIQMLIKEKVTLTDAEFLLLLEGKLHSSLDTQHSDDSNEADSPKQKKQKESPEEFDFSPVR